MGGSHATNQSFVRHLTNVLGSRKTLVVIIVLLLLVIIYLTLNQQGSIVCNDYASQQSKVEECKCPSRSVEERENQDYKVTVDDSKCSHGTQHYFPQAIIIGVRKAGTRALINMLKTHPDIFAATGEVHFFDHDENFEKGVQWYIERMPCTKNGQITIEKSPSYFTTGSVPMRIKMFSSHVMLLLIVRNPIDRAVSDFTQLNSKHSDVEVPSGKAFERLAFDSVTGDVNKDYNAIFHSMYDKYFQQWLEHFSLNQIHLVNGDILISNPVKELQMAEKFLGVKKYFQEDMFYFNKTKGFYCWKKANRNGDELSYCLGEGKGRRHPNISDTATAKLKQFFHPHNKRFYSLTHRHFGWDES